MVPYLSCDGYKICHKNLYPPGTEFVYSNATARSSRVEGQNEIVVFGIQYFIQKYIIDDWNKNFFQVPIEDIIYKYKRIITNYLGEEAATVSHLEYLHSLGHLPIHIKALPEGTICPTGVPFMTFVNTDPKCFWLTNFLETISQTVTWLPITSATTAYRFRKMLNEWANKTSSCPEFVQWQGHDFSMRGMSSYESCQISGAAHLLSFTGTDTIPAITFVEQEYGADCSSELIGGSVPATEHSIQCSYYKENANNENEYIDGVLNAFPAGIVSIVADGYDYWKFLSVNIANFKDRILGRNGKFVVRPDSGDPVRIVCGYTSKEVPYTAENTIAYMKASMSGYQKIWGNEDEYDCVLTSDGKYLDITGEELTELEVKGSIQVLYEIFGGTTNDKGYIELDQHIGLIYGDSITYERANRICQLLSAKGFASTNIVFGIGSYTYQFVTRDTYSIAFKATQVTINGEVKAIFKDPKTGWHKKSAKGLLSIVKDGNSLSLINNCTPEQEEQSELKTIFKDGIQYGKLTLSEIRKNLWANGNM